MELDRYRWLDDRLYDEGLRVFEGMVAEMISYGGDWSEKLLTEICNPIGIYRIGVVQFMKHNSYRQWLRDHYNEVGRYITEFIDVIDGKPNLAPDFAERLKQKCTHEVPEYARHLCDILRANEKAFAEAIRACNDIKTYCGLDFAFSGDRFSIEDFGNFFISHF